MVSGWRRQKTMGAADNDMAKLFCCWEDEAMKELGKSWEIKKSKVKVK